jgi:hypothetical protein
MRVLWVVVMVISRPPSATEGAKVILHDVLGGMTPVHKTITAIVEGRHALAN